MRREDSTLENGVPNDTDTVLVKSLIIGTGVLSLIVMLAAWTYSKCKQRQIMRRIEKENQQDEEMKKQGENLQSNQNETTIELVLLENVITELDDHKVNLPPPPDPIECFESAVAF